MIAVIFQVELAFNPPFLNTRVLIQTKSRLKSKNKHFSDESTSLSRVGKVHIYVPPLLFPLSVLFVPLLFCLHVWCYVSCLMLLVKFISCYICMHLSDSLPVPLTECAHLLLAHNAPVKVKNAQGWSPLAEAISYGDRQMSEYLWLADRPLKLHQHCVQRCWVSPLVHWNRCGFSRFLVWVLRCEKSDGGQDKVWSTDANQQLCLCTFFHAVASKRGHDAGLPPLSLRERGHSSRPSGFCVAMKGNSLDVFLSPDWLIMLKPLPHPFSTHNS